MRRGSRRYETFTSDTSQTYESPPGYLSVGSSSMCIHTYLRATLPVPIPPRTTIGHGRSYGSYRETAVSDTGRNPQKVQEDRPWVKRRAQHARGGRYGVTAARIQVYYLGKMVMVMARWLYCVQRDMFFLLLPRSAGRKPPPCRT